MCLHKLKMFQSCFICFGFELFIMFWFYFLKTRPPFLATQGPSFHIVTSSHRYTVNAHRQTFFSVRAFPTWIAQKLRLICLWLQVLIGEIGLCTFSGGQQKSLRLLSKHCTVPQVARRLLRFLGACSNPYLSLTVSIYDFDSPRQQLILYTFTVLNRKGIG